MFDSNLFSFEGTDGGGNVAKGLGDGRVGGGRGGDVLYAVGGSGGLGDRVGADVDDAEDGVGTETTN